MVNSSVIRRSWLIIPGYERTPLDYVRKYREGIKDIGMTPESFEADYHVAILVKPTVLRGF